MIASRLSSKYRIYLYKTVPIIFLMMLSKIANANKYYQDYSYNWILDESRAVVLGTIIDIDEYAYDPEIGPLTKYTISIEQVLYGEAEKDVVVYFVQGGFFPGGEIKRNINVVPSLPVGDTFIFCFSKTDFVYQPFVKAQKSILRVDKSRKKTFVTDADGFLIRLSKTVGLFQSNKVLKSFNELSDSQSENGQTNSSIMDVENIDSVIEDSSSAEEICSYIKALGKGKLNQTEPLVRILRPPKVKFVLATEEGKE